jgi:phage gp36-like protein
VAITRRSRARYADAAHLAAFGLPAVVLRTIPAFVDTVTHTGTGAATVTPGGYPASVYALRVRVSTGGAPGAGAIEVSLDGGTSYSAPATVPPSGVVQVPSTSNAIASGLTLTIAGTLALGDLYACDVASNVELNLDAASDWLDGYLARQFTLPLTAWDLTVRDACAAWAALKVLTVRGFDPEQGKDKAVVDAAKRAETWAEHVAQGRVLPNVTDSSADPIAADVAVSSSPRRRFR